MARWYKAWVADWIDDFADSLDGRLGTPRQSPLRLSAEATQAVLDAARDVSHRTERVNAPLASYLIGRYVATRVAAGAELDTALAEAVEVLRQTLPPPDPA